MIYKKIENFFSDITDDCLCPKGMGIVFIVLTFPIWFFIWLISRFWNIKGE